VEKDIDFVISHPNGWEGYQQTQMREAVVKAGFVPDTREGHARVNFVTEGEASLHFSIRNGLPTGAMEVSACRLLGMGVLTADNCFANRKETVLSLLMLAEERLISAPTAGKCNLGMCRRTTWLRRLLLRSVGPLLLAFISTRY
jgi:hypothetical protein